MRGTRPACSPRPSLLLIRRSREPLFAILLEKSRDLIHEDASQEECRQMCGHDTSLPPALRRHRSHSLRCVLVQNTRQPRPDRYPTRTSLRTDRRTRLGTTPRRSRQATLAFLSTPRARRSTALVPLRIKCAAGAHQSSRRHRTCGPPPQSRSPTTRRPHRRRDSQVTKTPRCTNATWPQPPSPRCPMQPHQTSPTFAKRGKRQWRCLFPDLTSPKALPQK